jgi:hypothetical protein
MTTDTKDSKIRHQIAEKLILQIVKHTRAAQKPDRFAMQFLSFIFNCEHEHIASE